MSETFDGDYRLHFHLAPPLLSKPDPATGRIAKREFGPWVLHAFSWLAHARRLRGTFWDIFGYLPERRRERQLIADYESDIDAIVAKLSPAALPAAVELAALPEKIRGFGYVKARNIEQTMEQRRLLLGKL